VSVTYKYSPFIVRSMPGQEMTAEELERQVDFVSSVADICDEISESDEVTIKRTGETK